MGVVIEVIEETFSGGIACFEIAGFLGLR